MKRLLSLLFSILIFFAFSLGAYAFDIAEEAEEQLEGYNDKLFSSLDGESIEILKELGFDKLDFNRISDFSPKDIFSFFIECLRGKTDGAIKTFLSLILIITLIACIYTYIPQNDPGGKMINICACCTLGVLTAPSVVAIFKASAAAFKLCCVFMYSFLPLIAGLVASSSKPMTALSMNSVVIYLINIINVISEKILVPFMGIYYSFVCSMCFSKDLNINTIAVFIKNTVAKILAVISSLFVGVLSVKGIFSSGTESVLTKGAKVIVSTAIPIIGNSMSEAYFAVSESMGLIKQTVGIFGIVIILVINLPVIIELFLFTLSFGFSKTVAQIFNLDGVADYLGGVSSMLKTLNLIHIFTLILLTVSTGLMIIIRGSAI